MKFPDWLPVYGDKDFKGKCPSESAEQMTFFNLIRKEHPEIARVSLHIKNEGKRTPAQMQKDKAEGLVVGASDIIIAGCPTFVCELKKKHGGRFQPNQLDFLKAAQENGSFVCVALGYEGAYEAFKVWINASK